MKIYVSMFFKQEFLETSVTASKLIMSVGNFYSDNDNCLPLHLVNYFTEGCVYTLYKLNKKQKIKIERKINENQSRICQ